MCCCRIDDNADGDNEATRIRLRLIEAVIRTEKTTNLIRRLFCERIFWSIWYTTQVTESQEAKCHVVNVTRARFANRTKKKTRIGQFIRNFVLVMPVAN